MKKIIVSAMLVIQVIIAGAQSPAFEWAKNMGGYHGVVAGKSIKVDLSGNVYTTG